MRVQWLFYRFKMDIIYLRFEISNIDIRRQKWIFSQHLFHSVVHLGTQSCSSPIQYLVALANFPLNLTALHSGTYPCCNRKNDNFVCLKWQKKFIEYGWKLKIAFQISPKVFLSSSSHVRWRLRVNDFHIEVDIFIPAGAFVGEKNSTCRRQWHVRH